MKKIAFYILVSVLATGCSDFLDIKPNQKMEIPKTLEDCELLLNDYGSMNTGYPVLGEISADDYFLRDADWQSIPNADDKESYIWSASILTSATQWQGPYRTVYLSNQIMDVLAAINRSDNARQYDKLKGAAYFYRAFAFHQLASVFAMPYHPLRAKDDLGIPLRLTPNLDEKSVRSTLQETYQQIVADYKQAVQGLPVVESLTGRPNKAAAYAGLARVYLDMQDEANAFRYADSCLALQDDLLDYNQIDAGKPLPIERFNREVLFPATSVFSEVLWPNLARVDKQLIESYGQHDRRLEIYFEHNSFDEGTYAFKGSYDNSQTTPFVGLTTSEAYLVRAECAARLNNVEQALADLNTLLANRIEQDHFVPVQETDKGKLLEIILQERRKELVFRGRRWSDLKRLNQEERFKKVLTRIVEGKKYTLEPNSLGYAHLIPEAVIAETGMPQNKR